MTDTFRPLGEIAASVARTVAAKHSLPVGGSTIAPPHSENPDALALVQRIRRKADLMALDAARGTTAQRDAQEISILAEIAAKMMGAANA